MNRLNLRHSVHLGNWGHWPPSFHASAKLHSTNSRPAATARAKEEEEVDVPELGWMWQNVEKKQPGSSSSPTAKMTVSNLRQERIRPKKSLGQNFLTDDVILSDIVNAAGVKPGDLVLEIGPGTGNLTKHLLEQGAVVTAIEKDDTLFDRLTEEYKQNQNLTIIKGDCLKVDIPEIVALMISSRLAKEASSSSEGAAAPKQDRPIKVVANLPYNITKEFLKTMLPMGHCVSELHIMIQDEVADRLVDKTPGRPDYRAMNLLVQYFSNPRYRFRIPKDKYYPAPGVDGALTTFDLLPPEQRVNMPDVDGIFLSVIYKAFKERRKMMRNNLQPMYTGSQVERALEAVSLRKDSRAQDLDLKQFSAFICQLHALYVAERELDQAL